MAIKFREGEYRIFAVEFASTVPHRRIREYDLRRISGATLAEACEAVDEVRSAAETRYRRVHMEQVHDITS